MNDAEREARLGRRRTGLRGTGSFSYGADPIHRSRAKRLPRRDPRSQTMSQGPDDAVGLKPAENVEDSATAEALGGDL